MVPVRNVVGEVSYILDIDSEKLNSFDLVDQKYLEEIASLIGRI